MGRAASSGSTSLVDHGSILLVVYVAFSDGVVDGIWHQLDARHLPRCCWSMPRCWRRSCWRPPRSAGARLQPGRRITIVFCGSKKSLASRPADGDRVVRRPVGLVVLPLMLFHQIQLMVCAALARRYAAGPTPNGRTVAPALTTV